MVDSLGRGISTTNRFSIIRIPTRQKLPHGSAAQRTSPTMAVSAPSTFLNTGSNRRCRIDVKFVRNYVIVVISLGWVRVPLR